MLQLTKRTAKAMMKQLANKFNKLNQVSVFRLCDYYLAVNILRHNKNQNYKNRKLIIDLSNGDYCERSGTYSLLGHLLVD